jgi:RNA polymerase sigma-70 factor (ECF subfamily)
MPADPIPMPDRTFPVEFHGHLNSHPLRWAGSYLPARRYDGEELGLSHGHEHPLTLTTTAPNAADERGDAAAPAGNERAPSATQTLDLSDVTAMASGDASGLERLYRRHAPMLLGLARRILRDAASPEDLVHDVFLEVWRRASSYEPQRGSVRAWLLLRLRSRAIDRLRNARLRERAPWIDATLLALDDMGNAQFERLLAAPDRARVERALASMSADHRDVLWLAYYEGLTMSEIAARLAIPLGTVKSRTQAALARLRAVLDAGGSDA